MLLHFKKNLKFANNTIFFRVKKETKLLFAVSSFRMLFYENSIGGKGKLEEGLKRHIKAILQQNGQQAAGTDRWY